MELTCLFLGCPVVSCARHLIHLRDNDADLDTPMCAYFERKGDAGKSVTRTHLGTLIQLWTENIGFD